MQLYAKDGGPRLLPKVLTLADMVKVWRAGTSDVPLHTANMLDRVALLHDCVQHLTGDDAALSARFARMDMALFLPWGLRLAALLEEMLGQGLEAADLAYVENEVAAPAAALLGALGRIGRRAWISTWPAAKLRVFRLCSCPAPKGRCWWRAFPC